MLFLLLRVEGCVFVITTQQQLQRISRIRHSSRIAVTYIYIYSCNKKYDDKYIYIYIYVYIYPTLLQKYIDSGLGNVSLL